MEGIDASLGEDNGAGPRGQGGPNQCPGVAGVPHVGEDEGEPDSVERFEAAGGVGHNRNNASRGDGLGERSDDIARRRPNRNALLRESPFEFDVGLVSLLNEDIPYLGLRDKGVLDDGWPLDEESALVIPALLAPKPARGLDARVTDAR